MIEVDSMCDNIFLKTQELIKSENVVSSTLERLKQLETLLLFEFIKLSPLSMERKTRSHRKVDTDNRLIINGHTLCVCYISKDGNKPQQIDNLGGGSYIDMKKKTLTYYKNKKCIHVVYDLSKMWSSIVEIAKFKDENKLNMVLFTNKRAQKYELFYPNSTQKHRSFLKDSHNLVKYLVEKKCGFGKFDDYPTINSIFVFMNKYNIDNPHSSCTTEEQEESENESEEPAATIDGGVKTDTVNSELDPEFMWEQIFEVLGILPRDCQCKQYGISLYDRCVVNGKSRRGLRPKHKPGCTKIICPI